MGHQTSTSVCRKCGSVTIKTTVGWGRTPIESSNCTCDKTSKEKEVDFKSSVHNILFDDKSSSQEKIYDLKRLFLND